MATELAKAYVQIIPSAKGIKGSIGKVLDGEAGDAGNKAGATVGGNLVSKIKGVIVAAGIGKALQQSLTQGAALQQSLGGIETLFKDSANKVITNAKQAYKTAGMSANEYMESVTSFSASLLQGLSGDTNKAADVADMALKDMSDNANKMGTSMELIQNAYQGFAKQNYTMLDNLKLGYGGTKTEMERLLAKAQEITGVKYDINNLSDVYSAIHVIQEEMGITGTTAIEASKTFSGSFASMKAAANDFLGNLALGTNITSSLMALGETVKTFVIGNLVPMLGNVVISLGEIIGQQGGAMLNVGTSMIASFISGIASKLPDLVPQAIAAVATMASNVVANLPKIITAGISLLKGLVQGIINSLPTLIAEGPRIINNFADAIYAGLGKLILTGIELLGSLIKGIVKSVPTLIANAGEIFLMFLNIFSLSKMASLGKNLITSLKDGIKAFAKQPTQTAKSIVDGIKNAFNNINWSSVGTNIISGIKKGLLNGIGAIATAAKDVAKKALDSAKNFLGIHSPSRVFETQVGEMISAGMAIGIEDNAKTVKSAINKLSDVSIDSLDMDLSYNARGRIEAATSSDSDQVDYRAIKDIVQNEIRSIVIELNGREFGRAVRRAVV